MMSDQYNAAQPYGGAPSQQKGPDNPSSDYQAMLPYWQMVEAINGGAETIRRAGELYLHRMTNESADDYRIRRTSAPFTNIYLDVSRNLASSALFAQSNRGTSHLAVSIVAA
jgi:hypothetical protein